MRMPYVLAFSSIVLSASAALLPRLAAAQVVAPPAAVTPHLVAAPAEAPSTPATEPTSWYGWQTLIVDGASVATILAGIPAGTPSLSILGLAGYSLGAPIVHVAHDRGGVAAGSLGLRVGGVFAGGALGYYAVGPCEKKSEFDCDDPGDGWGPIVGALFGAGAGAVVAMVIDSTLLGHERRGGGTDSARVRLGVVPRGSGGSLVLSGSF